MPVKLKLSGYLYFATLCIILSCLGVSIHYMFAIIRIEEDSLRQQKVSESEAKCNVFDIYKETVDKHKCVRTKTVPAFYICIHPVKTYVYVSASIKHDGVWQRDVMDVFQELLRNDPELGVIDIGANIGQFSMMASAMGHPVVAVEARLNHVEMIHHALWLNEMQDTDFVLLHNAISDKRGKLTQCHLQHR